MLRAEKKETTVEFQELLGLLLDGFAPALCLRKAGLEHPFANHGDDGSAAALVRF